MGLLAPHVSAQGRGKLAPKLRLVIPAVSRSSLDNTARSLGDALVIGGLCDEIEYENMEGKNGAMGLTQFADKYTNDPNSLLVADSNVFGAAILQKSLVESRPWVNCWNACVRRPSKRQWLWA
jgi:putative tricarboxylic transport membrane protein